ncbi:MAG: amidinotransferase [Bacteroidetes bacterium]|nr:amidinotransferase [Bacteroidota bacterium]
MNNNKQLQRLPAPSTILMIRPSAFGYNEETADSNFFQQITPGNTDIQRLALNEFDNMVNILRSHDIDVIVIEDTVHPVKPDAVFPNNWLSTSPNGTISVFPMHTQNRRAEKREDILKWLNENFIVKELQDWSEFEAEGRFLEGTGSMVIDHDNKMIYAAVSVRTNISVLEKFAAANGYQAIVFLAVDKNGHPVYHTNVVMSLGENFAVLCEEAIEEEWELIAVRQILESTGHSIIPISKEQMHCFAGNMIEIENMKSEKFLILSQKAFESLHKEQKRMLEAYCSLLPIPVPTIESIAGGSVRCMIAEIFLKKL